MTKSNLQVRITDGTRNRIARLSPRSTSAFVREAVEEKLRRELFLRMEKQWINALRKEPEDPREAARWLKAEAWGDK